jgi:monoamine oxidase
MARTPLFRLLERSLRLSRLAATTGRSPAELTHEFQEARRAWTRKEFLRTAGAAAAGIGLVGCAPGRRPGGAVEGGFQVSPTGDQEVVVIGAGIAGLTAGWRLKQAGVPVRIFEAQNRIGGRMLSLRDHFPDGQVAELGGELIDTGHTHLRALARELGLELNDLHAAETMEPEVWHFDGRPIGEVELVEAYRPVAARITADLEALHSLEAWPWASYSSPNGAEALDHTSLAEWLAAVDMEPWFRRLLDVGFTTEYGLEADRQSVLNLHFLIDHEPDPFVIYGESDERFHVRGGNDLIPRALGDRLEAEIETGTRLESVRARPDGDYDLSLRRDGSSHTVRARHVVLALPFTLLREVELGVDLPPVKLRAIDELTYGTNAKLMMGFRERVWRTRHGAGGAVLSDLPFQLTWETSREQSGTHGILTNFTGGDQGLRVGEGTPEDQARQVVEALEQVFPGVAAAHDPASAVRFHWPTHAWTRGSYACYGPGQWTGICGAEGERVGNLHFAGEHCSLDAQGFMEGGCETGERAAREILEDLGRQSIEPAA